MSELRKDIISGRWVIIATERGKRPDDFRPPPLEKKKEPAGFCPFCSGNESKTPPEVYALRKTGIRPNQPGWLVRVVPNKFPALTRGMPPVQHENGIFRWMDGVGVHEVVIETPDHERELSDLPLYHLQHVIEAYKLRVISIEEEFQYKYVHIFKNKGREAGASLSHPHSQIVATPIIPKKVNEELYGCERLHRQFGECIGCRIIRDEIKAGERLILKNDHFCAIAPFAPRFPFETRIYPLRHSAWFTGLTKAESLGLARTMKTILTKLKMVLSDPPYNFYFHQGPNPNQPHEAWANLEASFHWHIEIIPILTRAAGFEWGTGFYINPVPPEIAASFLRNSES
ncbi:MAG: galactose-1-phosphate uridylyltransferase [Candidatus Aminicenantales bacterium]